MLSSVKMRIRVIELLHNRNFVVPIVVGWQYEENQCELKGRKEVFQAVKINIFGVLRASLAFTLIEISIHNNNIE